MMIDTIHSLVGLVSFYLTPLLSYTASLFHVISARKGTLFGTGRESPPTSQHPSSSTVSGRDEVNTSLRSCHHHHHHHGASLPWCCPSYPYVKPSGCLLPLLLLVDGYHHYRSVLDSSDSWESRHRASTTTTCLLVFVISHQLALPPSPNNSINPSPNSSHATQEAVECCIQLVIVL